MLRKKLTYNYFCICKIDRKFGDGPSLHPEYFKYRLYFFNKIMINLNRLPTYIIYYTHRYFEIIFYTQSKRKKKKIIISLV